MIGTSYKVIEGNGLVLAVRGYQARNVSSIWFYDMEGLHRMLLKIIQQHKLTTIRSDCFICMFNFTILFHPCMSSITLHNSSRVEDHIT